MTKRVKTHHDCSTAYLRQLIGNKPTTLNTWEDLKRELILPIRETFFVLERPAFESDNILPIEVCEEDVIALPLSLGYELFSAMNKPTITVGTEEDFASFVQRFTGELWNFADDRAGPLHFRQLRNVSDKSGVTQALKRPDVCFWVRGALLFKAEHKRNLDDFDQAVHELISKMQGWNLVALHGLPFLPCYASGGSVVQFFAICPPVFQHGTPVLYPVSDQYDLAKPLHRLWVLRIALNMLRVFISLRDGMPVFVPALYKPIERPSGGTITIMDKHVEKTCLPAPDGVYACLGFGVGATQLPRSITVLDKVALRPKPGRAAGMVLLKIAPVCMQDKPTSLAMLFAAICDLLTAISAFHAAGYVHRDIRWPNFMRDADGHWRLADFELADRSGLVLPAESISDSCLPPENRPCGASSFTYAGDVWQIGRLLLDVPAVLQTVQVTTLAGRLMSEDPTLRPSARDLLGEPAWF